MKGLRGRAPRQRRCPPEAVTRRGPRFLLTHIDDLGRDLGIGLRMLVRHPGFSAVAILTLALGIGANAAIYSMFEQTLMRPLPVADPGRLVNLAAPGPKPGGDNCNQAGPCAAVFNDPMSEDLAALRPGISDLAAHRGLEVTLKPGRARQGERGVATFDH